MKIKRIIFICLIIVAFGLCMFFMNKNYDPLSRYNCDDPVIRNEIKENLSEEEIEYIIDYQIDADYFKDYLSLPGFNIYHIDQYNEANLYLNKLSDYEIVNVVEKLISKDLAYTNVYKMYANLTYYEILDEIAKL